MKVLKFIILYAAISGFIFACKNANETEKSLTPLFEIQVIVRTDVESIDKGKELFNSKCSFCHDPNSTNAIVGPGLKDILKKSKFPISNKLATPENLVNQLRNPYKDMPSFSYLPEENVLNLIAYLNTL